MFFMITTTFICGCCQPGTGSQPAGMPGIFSALFGAPRPAAPAVPAAPVNLDINSLLDNLVKTGLIKKEANAPPAAQKELPKSEVKPVLPGPVKVSIKPFIQTLKTSF